MRKSAIEGYHRGAGLAARLFAWTRESINENDVFLVPRHDGQPSVQVPFEYGVFGKSVACSWPKGHVASLRREVVGDPAYGPTYVSITSRGRYCS